MVLIFPNRPPPLPAVEEAAAANREEVDASAGFGRFAKRELKLVEMGTAAGVGLPKRLMPV